MKRHHLHLFTFAAIALLVGVSISGGPVVWAVAVMLAPLLIAMYLTSRGVVHHGQFVAHNDHFKR